MRRVLPWVMLVLALVPSAHLAWNARDLPHLGYFHDDALYWVTAKSLADGSGYRIPSMPGEPYQTRYPPFYPWLLSWVWRLKPQFPQNLPAVTLLNWLVLPVFVWLARRLFSGLGLPRALSFALCTLLALNPFFAFFSISVMSDLTFSTLLAGSLIAAERATGKDSKDWWSIAAGLLAGASYLTRAASLPLLISAPLCLMLRGQRRRAILFAAVMSPAVIAWQLWVRAHLTSSQDLVSLFYLDYSGYYLENMSRRNMPVFIWKNFGGFIGALGNLIVFQIDDSFWPLTVRRLLAFAAIAGSVRLARRTGGRQYPLFAAFYLALLLIWHYPPNERFLLPVFPFLLAGFSTEVGHIFGLAARSIRGAQFSRRFAAGLASAFLGVLALYGLLMSFQAFAAVLPEVIAQRREQAASDQASFEWISHNVPAGSLFLSYYDPVLYLHTGRKAVSVRIPPKLYYLDDHAAIRKLFDSFPEIAGHYRLEYLFLHSADYERDLPEAERIAMLGSVRSNPRFHLLYKSRTSSVYRIGHR